MATFVPPTLKRVSHKAEVASEDESPQDQTLSFVDDDDELEIEDETPKGWAKLLPLTTTCQVQDLIDNTITIGRNAGSTIRFQKNSYISSKHCTFLRDEDGVVKLIDTSSNGTYIDGVLIGKGNAKVLEHGMKIFLVKPGKDPAKQIGFSIQFTDVSSEPAAKRAKRTTEEEEEEEDKAAAPNEETAAPKKNDEEEEEDAVATNLTCAICREIMHDCLSLLPCLHNFCAGCYSQWSAQESSCPECRVQVQKVQRNHTLRSVVDAYLAANPSKKRPDDEIAALDQQNKFSRDSVQIASTHVNSEDDYSGSDSEEDDTFYDSCRACRTDNRLPTVDGTVCTGTAHDMCQCCYMTMPTSDHRPNCPPVLPIKEKMTPFTLPAQPPGAPRSCSLCVTKFCNMTFQAGCGCQDGCLKPFKDTTIRDSHLLTAVNGNTYESKILLDYAQGKNWSNNELAQDIMAKFGNGDIEIAITGFTLDTPCCRRCAANVLKQMAFEYRLKIPSSDLPSSAKSKPDGSRRDACWYGYNCRTQFNRPHHATNFDHTCTPRR